MGIVGTLLRNRRAGEAHLAWKADRVAHAKARDVLARVPGPVLARGRLTGTNER